MSRWLEKIPVPSRQPARLRRGNREIGDVRGQINGDVTGLSRLVADVTGQVSIMEFAAVYTDLIACAGKEWRGRAEGVGQ